MIRPEIIYLEEPILIAGIKILHSREGLVYLIDHYKCLLKQDVKRLPEITQHMELLIKNWEIHLELYKKQHDHITTGTESNS
ncbi:MAG TPA: hypothetical protein VL443_24270 [Cyclobacteriaceae bacterium]|jgi:hypothetical protein|nr:hypothetical protein [Cyclobacteriaceae bacterium]